MTIINTIITIITTIYSFIKTHVQLTLGIIIGILCLIIGAERKKIDKLDTQVQLSEANTKDQVLTAQQQADKEKIAANNNSLDTINQNMLQSERDKEKAQKEASNKTPAQVVDYWNKPKN